MSKSLCESLFNLFIFALLGFFVVKAFTLSGGAGRAPLIIGIPTFILMCFQVAKPLIRLVRPGNKDGQMETTVVATETGVVMVEDGKKIVSEILWLCIFTLIIVFLGVIYGSLTFLIMYLRLHNKDSWLFSLAVSIMVVVVAYLIFQKALQMQLYEGILPSMVLDWYDL